LATGEKMSAPNLTGFYRDGRFRRRVVLVSSASTGLVLSAKDSGTLFRIPELTTQMAYLPKISSGRLGLTYEFLVEAQSSAANNFNIVTNLDSSARIFGIGTSGSTDAIGQSAQPVSTMSRSFARFTAVSSVLWVMEQAYAFRLNSSGEVLSTQIGVGGWSTGTTST
jgi:hypothetical protein